MNMSLKELFLWILSADYPSLSEIWTWLITVPWWLALITIYVFWLLGRAIVNISWNAYALMSKRSYQMGEWASFWSGEARAAYRHMLAQTRSFGLWLLRVLSIR